MSKEIIVAIIGGVCAIAASLGGAYLTASSTASKEVSKVKSEVDNVLSVTGESILQAQNRISQVKSEVDNVLSVTGESILQAQNRISQVKEEIRFETEDIVRRTIQLEIEKLMVSSAGSISKEGRVEYIKGVPFTATREADGRFRINFLVPFPDLKPIVVATPVDSETLINVIDVDKTGFSVQGISINNNTKRHAAFNFILVEPENK
ncbi:MAG: hypothetical protein ACFFCW_34750 [Candidatus Hodarchaeota archaeon]